jgi:hypothetical protein
VVFLLVSLSPLLPISLPVSLALALWLEAYLYFLGT